MIKSIEYHPDGSVKRVAYKCAGDYPPVAASPNGIGLGGVTETKFSHVSGRSVDDFGH